MQASERSVRHETHTASMSITRREAPLSRHPVRGRLNAWFFHFMDAYLHRKYGAIKRRLYAGLPDSIVELGSGSGANFRYLRPNTHVVAVEPNEYMHGSLRTRARRQGVTVDVRSAGAERLDLPDESTDAVITSLVAAEVAALSDYIRSDWGRGTTIAAIAPAQMHDEAFRAWAARAEANGASPGAALDLLEMNARIEGRPARGPLSRPRGRRTQ